MFCAHLPIKPMSLESLIYEHKWIEVNSSRPKTPNADIIPMMNPNSIKLNEINDGYTEIIDEMKDEATIKAQYSRWIAVLLVSLIIMIIGFPLLCIWRKLFHGDHMYQIQFDGAFEHEQKHRQRLRYL